MDLLQNPAKKTKPTNHPSTQFNLAPLRNLEVIPVPIYYPDGHFEMWTRGDWERKSLFDVPIEINFGATFLYNPLTRPDIIVNVHGSNFNAQAFHTWNNISDEMKGKGRVKRKVLNRDQFPVPIYTGIEDCPYKFIRINTLMNSLNPSLKRPWPVEVYFGATLQCATPGSSARIEVSKGPHFNNHAYLDWQTYAACD